MNIIKSSERSSIVVQWDEVDDFFPTTYVVTWTSERDLNDIQRKTVEEQSSYTITGLTLDTVYTITVYATNRCGTGPEYRTSVSLTTSSNTSAITSTMAITSAASSSTSTGSNAVINPSATTTDPITTSGITNLKTSSTNPSAVITSTNTPTDNASPVSTTHPVDTSTADENSKIFSISICNKHILSISYSYVCSQVKKAG